MESALKYNILKLIWKAALNILSKAIQGQEQRIVWVESDRDAYGTSNLYESYIF